MSQAVYLQCLAGWSRGRRQTTLSSSFTFRGGWTFRHFSIETAQVFGCQVLAPISKDFLVGVHAVCYDLAFLGWSPGI
jgi:hypothetical protein